MSQDLAAQSGTPAVAVETAAGTPEHGLFARLAAEAFGTFVLVLGIVGTATFNAANNGQILPVALAAGLLLMAAFAAVGGVSGGHFNPAVTLGMTIAGRASWADLVPYWFVQTVGGTAAAAVMFSVIPTTLPTLLGLEDKAALFATTANGFGSHSPLATLTQGSGTPAEFSLWGALLVEVVATAVFVGVFLAVTSKRSTATGAAAVIGLALGGLLIVTWPVTNGSLNPVRSFASTVFASGWTWDQLWLFVVAPLLGGALAALFYRAFMPVVIDDEVYFPSTTERVGTEPAAGLVVEHDVVDDGALASAPESTSVADRVTGKATTTDATSSDAGTGKADATDKSASDAGAMDGDEDGKTARS